MSQYFHVFSLTKIFNFRDKCLIHMYIATLRENPRDTLFLVCSFFSLITLLIMSSNRYVSSQETYRADFFFYDTFIFLYVYLFPSVLPPPPPTPFSAYSGPYQPHDAAFLDLQGSAFLAGLSVPGSASGGLAYS
jgi:hypothetical protein